MINLGARLSKDFRLGELLWTSHAEFNEQQHNPPAEVVDRLHAHVMFLLQPARDLVGALKVSSGWRCPDLNAKVGGSGANPDEKPSAHLRGDASDNQALDMHTVDAFLRVARSGLPFDKVILETRLNRDASVTIWFHLQSPHFWDRPERRVLMRLVGRGFEKFNGSDPAFLALRKDGGLVS